MELYCSKHSPCEHETLLCDCKECWKEERQCEYSFTSNESLDKCLHPSTSNDYSSVVGLAGSNRLERGLPILREQTRDTNLYCTETIRDLSTTPQEPREYRGRRESGEFIEAGDNSDTQLSVCPGTLEVTGFHFPTPGSKRWKGYISLLNEHQQPEIETRSDTGFIKSIRKKLFTETNMDTDGNCGSTGQSIRSDDIGRSDTNNHGKTRKSNTMDGKRKISVDILSNNVSIACCTGKGSSGGTTETKRSRREDSRTDEREGGEEETDNIEQDIQEESNDGSESTISNFIRSRLDRSSGSVRKQYYTFVLHKRNQEEHWKRESASRSKQAPCFIGFDHGDHTHVIYASDERGGNAARQRGRIAKYLGATAAGSAECISSFSRVNLLRNFILYCIRNGIETVNIHGNKVNEELKEAKILFEQMFEDRNPEEVIQDSMCKTYIEERKEEKRRISHNKKNNIVDVLETIIDEEDVWTGSDWNMKVDISVKNQLMREFGLNVDSYVQRIIRNKRHKESSKLRTSTLTDIILSGVEWTLKSEIEPSGRISMELMKGMEWLMYLMKENDIDDIEFLAWNEAIKDKRYVKINSLVLQGPTNAGKSLIAETLLGPIKPEEIPRERDNSGFHLDQLPEASAALFEEPLITPITVGTWKLLLEGKTIKTDIKHKDKEGIRRIPIYITTATKITATIDAYEANQVNQRVKIFEFKRTIEHREEDYTRILNQQIRRINRAPVYIKPIHFQLLFLLKYHQIIAHLRELDERLTIDPGAITITAESEAKAKEWSQVIHKAWIMTKMDMEAETEEDAVSEVRSLLEEELSQIEETPRKGMEI